MKPIDLIERYAYEIEEIKCNNILRQYQKN